LPSSEQADIYHLLLIPLLTG